VSDPLESLSALAERPRAVLDSCVLYPPGLRNLLMWLAVEKVFVPKWTEEIHAEWIDNALENDAKKNSPPLLIRAKLERTRELMDRNAERSLVTGYEHWIASLALPDPDDRHVLAAALESGASAIVTFNVRHFPAAVLSAYGVEAVKPDAFLCELFENDRAGFERAIEGLLASLKNPPMTLERLLQGWRKVGLLQLALKIEAHRPLVSL